MRILESKADRLLLELANEADTARLGVLLADVARPGTVIGLVGHLGAGKTRLSRAFAEAMGVPPDAIASPTFVLIQEYQGRLPIYHFDTYRLDDPDEFDALGAGDYWAEATGICLVEWADRVVDRLPAETWWIRLSSTGATSRLAELSGGPIEALRGRIAEEIDRDAC